MSSTQTIEASTPIRSQPSLQTTLKADGSLDAAGQYQGYDNVHWYVGNAKQAAAFYITRMGFERVAYRGLETGSKIVASHVVRNGDVTFVFTSPLHAPKTTNSTWSQEENDFLEEIHTHLKQHGDAVRDVAFQVDDVDAIYAAAVKNGAYEVYPPKELSDEHGTVRYARIKTYGDTTHTLIQRNNYSGAFLPGFRHINEVDRINAFLPEVRLEAVDHCVGNQSWNEMENACD